MFTRAFGETSQIDRVPELLGKLNKKLIFFEKPIDNCMFFVYN
jgi:hypothetical protein